MNNASKKIKTLARLALVSAAIIWGGSFVVLKNALDSFPIFTLFSIRFIFSALMLFLIFFPRFKQLRLKTVLVSLPIGIFLFLAYTFQTYGLIETTPGVNAFLTDVYCVLTPFLYWMIAKKSPDRYNIAASVICIVGVGLVSLNSGLSMNTGDILTIICSVFFGLHLVFISHFGRDCDPIVLTVLQFAVAGLLSLVPALLFEQMPAITADNMLQMGYLIFLATAGAMLLQNVGQKYTPASQAAILLGLESVFGVAFSIIFYRERPTLQMYLGFACIFVAVIISETKLSMFKRKGVSSRLAD